MAVAAQHADEWRDSEVTKVRTEAPPRRARPVALDEVSPTVGRVLGRAIAQLCGLLLFCWFLKFIWLG